MILKDSRYAGRLPIGIKAVLDTVGHTSLREFYTKWYRPGLMGFVAVGDFDPEWIEAKVREHFSRLRPRGDAPERVVYPVPDHEEPLFAITTDPEAAANFVSIFFKQDVRRKRTAGDYRRFLVEELYGGMINQRLNELTRLPEPPFAFAVAWQLRMVRSKEFFLLGAGVEDNGFEAGVESVLTEVERVRQFGFTGGELKRQKKEMLRRMEQAYRERDKRESAALAHDYVHHLLDGEPVPGLGKELQLHRELLPGIGLAEVNAFADSWTGEKNRVVAIFAPEKEGVKVPTEEELTAVFARVSDKRIEELTGVVFAQIDSLRTAGTTGEHLTKAKETAKRKREVELKENEFWVSRLVRDDFHGLDPLRLLEYGKMVDSLTLEEVREAAEKYFDMENYVRVVLLPEE